MLNRISFGLVCCLSLLLVSCAQETPKVAANATQNQPAVSVPVVENPTPSDETQTSEKEDNQTQPAESKPAEPEVTEPAETVMPETNAPANTSSTESAVIAADGVLMLSPPAGWNKTEASGMFVEIEFAIPSEGDESNNGRMTGMQASGSIEDNIDRWYNQFTQPDGSNTKDKAIVEELDVSGMKVHKVDISGTFMDGVGPVAPKVERKDYRMLGAIVEMEGDGKYFLKFYGPKSLVDRHEKSFSEMLQSLKLVQ